MNLYQVLINSLYYGLLTSPTSPLPATSIQKRAESLVKNQHPSIANYLKSSITPSTSPPLVSPTHLFHQQYLQQTKRCETKFLKENSRVPICR